MDQRGEEQTELRYRVEGDHTFFQLDQPIDGKMGILQQHPATRLGGVGDGLISLFESLGHVSKVS